MIINIGQFIIGGVFLYYGAEYLIDGSKLFAEKFKLPQIVIGITLVAFGTSLPEMIVSIFAILKGDSGIVIGNVIGSNIANIGLVLGLTTILIPIIFSLSQIKFDMYFLLMISLFPLVFMFIGDLYFWHGLFFIILLIGYCWHLFKKEKDNEFDNHIISGKNYIYIITKLIFGVLGLSLGAKFFILGAGGIAIAMGVSSLVIGMSIVALGTSLPELATSIKAAKDNHPSIVIGNIIGSNIMNILAVFGITLLVRPISINFFEVKSQILFMLILTLALLVLLRLRGGVSRVSGLLLFMTYLIFLFFNFELNLVLGL